ncbi:MAG: TnsA endonuclease N-terminal domain-containing protein [Anaerolineae bacterium]|nr:TnsA endonuclease N-terminal domain-containing protein [Anaerolineae bacterium]
MPVRNPSNRYGRNIVGKFPSLKLGRMVVFESRIEQDQIYLMEYDQNVVFYEEQPFTIEYQYEGRLYKYTPDFRVVEVSGRHTLVECKPQRFINKDDNQRRFEAGQQWCAGHSWEFRVVTDQDARVGFRLENIKMLWQFARYKVSPDMKARIYAALNTDNVLTLDGLAARIDPNNPRSAVVPIFHLLFHHELETLIVEAKITGNSPIYLPQAAEVV